jgi:hypothetical protein
MARKLPPLASRALYILSESTIPLPTDQASRSRRINQRVWRNQFFRPSEKGLKASSLRNNPPYRSSTSSRPQLIFSLCRNLRKPANFNCGEVSPEFAFVQCCDWWGKIDLRGAPMQDRTSAPRNPGRHDAMNVFFKLQPGITSCLGMGRGIYGAVWSDMIKRIMFLEPRYMRASRSVSTDCPCLALRFY